MLQGNREWRLPQTCGIRGQPCVTTDFPKNRDNLKAKCVEQRHAFLHFKVSFSSYHEFGLIQVFSVWFGFSFLSAQKIQNRQHDMVVLTRQEEERTILSTKKKGEEFDEEGGMLVCLDFSEADILKAGETLL